MPRVFLKLADPDQAKFFVRSSFATSDGASAMRPTRNQPNVVIADISESDIGPLVSSGAVIYPDFEFSIFPPDELARPSALYWEPPAAEETTMLAGKNLQDVLNHIHAPEAWTTSRGLGATIAVVDTGICPTLSEFPAAKRFPFDIPSAYSGNHWADTKGHGSMCATIAAATKSGGGKFDGVAPDAMVLSARTTLMASDIHTIYDELITAKKQRKIPGPLVISNSYGLYTCSAPAALPEDHPYLGNNIVDKSNGRR